MHVVDKMFEEIDKLNEEVMGYKFPKGTKENPAVTCRDVFLGHPEFQDGWYWIDPNMGALNDSIHVWCNLTAHGETCVYPVRKTRMVIPRQWKKDKNNLKWFSEFEDGFKIEYSSEVQLNLLRLNSNFVTQRFTYFCTNSAAWYDQKSRGFEHALTLMGSADHEFETRDLSGDEVPFDGCKDHRSNTYSMFEIRTRKLDWLPVIDFMPKDYGEPWQQFGFEAGPVCFS